MVKKQKLSLHAFKLRIDRAPLFKNFDPENRKTYNH